MHLFCAALFHLPLHNEPPQDQWLETMTHHLFCSHIHSLGKARGDSLSLLNTVSSGVAQRTGVTQRLGDWTHPKPHSISQLVLMLTAFGTSAWIVGLSLWLLGFLIACWQGSKGECPEGTGKEGMHF